MSRKEAKTAVTLIKKERISSEAQSVSMATSQLTQTEPLQQMPGNGTVPNR